MGQPSSIEITVLDVRIPPFDSPYAVGVDPSGRTIKYRIGSRRDARALVVWQHDSAARLTQCVDFTTESQIVEVVDSGEPWPDLESIVEDLGSPLPDSSEEDRLQLVALFAGCHRTLGTRLPPDIAAHLSVAIRECLAAMAQRESESANRCPNCDLFSRFVLNAHKEALRRGTPKEWVALLNEWQEESIWRHWRMGQLVTVDDLAALSATHPP